MYFMRVDLKAGYMQPRIADVSVSESVWIVSCMLKNGVISMLGQIHLKVVETIWALVMPRAIPNVDPSKVIIIV